jgi:hypothetical protein
MIKQTLRIGYFAYGSGKPTGFIEPINTALCLNVNGLDNARHYSTKLLRFLSD